MNETKEIGLKPLQQQFLFKFMPRFYPLNRTQRDRPITKLKLIAHE